ncbi:MMPL family transporter [Frankia sp. CNm7]|uniref:MMPL family transporter n=1 Tax=Frankia nepalensis TaxID=1836974 RepID=A0A937RIT0_9ACTN|nr:MMPL family transporter [Frankia nepalensis]MBL7501358.1 MMPL family transporter [Frankia nepalensis]MBL7509855.1 MMPL family transporter [Frankia nepalensis]MBL7524339.1 MMPL family transporter [Frankia nepalensis]MBL7629614.1 MMPL family transporter [Frankia nepalensis]
MPRRSPEQTAGQPAGHPAPARSPSGAEARPSHLAARAARWSVRHRKLAVFGWLGVVVGVLLIGNLIGTTTLKEEDWLLGEDGRAQQTLRDHGFVSHAGENVLIQLPTAPAGGPLTDPAVSAAVTDVVTRIQATGEVTAVRAPVAAPGATEDPGLVSTDGRSVLVTFDITGEVDTAADRVEPVMDAVTAAGAAHQGLAVEQFGDASSEKALDETMGDDFQRAEIFSIPMTIAILLVVFGALVAALVPVALALTAFVGALGVVAFTSRLMPTNEIATSVMLLIGLAVGVDYALFYIRREREERAKGHSPKQALEIAAETSGHTVLVSGLTVAVSLAGLMITGMSAFTGIAIGTMVVVLVALLGSLTVLPALLSMLGDRIELGRLPWHRPAAPDAPRSRRARRAARRAARAGTAGGDTAALTQVLGATIAADRAAPDAAGRPGKVRLLDRLMRRPGTVAVVTGGLLVALAVPTLGMHTAEQGVSDLPQDIPIMKTYQRITTAFPGGPTPAVIVVSAPDVTAAPVTAAIDDLRARAIEAKVGFDPMVVTVSEDKQVARVLLPLAGGGTDDASIDAVRALRDDLVPATIETVPGASADVGGWAAGSLDFNSQLNVRTPLVIGFVLILAFGLLLVAFRSAAVAAMAVGLNLLSVGAAYGLLVLIFQHHWADGLLDYTATGTIANWMPLMLFVILFGLSMDYQVFLLSRVREARMAGQDMRTAALTGLRRSAGVVTSAAIIMVAIFGIFATLSQVSMKQLGIGLGAAILIDATIIRVLLMPALLTLLGDRVWRPKAGATPAAGTGAGDLPAATLPAQQTGQLRAHSHTS